MNSQSLLNQCRTQKLDHTFLSVYSQSQLNDARTRFSSLIEKFIDQFGDMPDTSLFSAPGRTEIIGNHTDHQNGCVIAGAVSLDAIAVAAPCNEPVISLISEGYAPIHVSLDTLSPQESEKNTTAALVRGIAAEITKRGYTVSGANISMSSNVLSGSGLSSSACFEVLIGCILNEFYCGSALDAQTLAKIGQVAENVFFGKPSGLMDQMACAVGGCVYIDFANPSAPDVVPIAFSPDVFGCALVIVDSGADHADLTDDYAAIPAEMKQCAAFFHQTLLREVNADTFFTSIKQLREQVNDRAVLRSIHFFNEIERVKVLKDAMCAKDEAVFFQTVLESGRSSWELLQNISSPSHPNEQSVALALTFAERLLHGQGAVRVHGGGFAGTIQAYVPHSMLKTFVSGMEQVLHPGCCHVLTIRQAGCVAFKTE